MNKSEVILELGAEGGSITLYGIQTEGGWIFSRNVIDWTPELIDEERIQHKSPVVNSWEAALALLDQYAWQRLSPLLVHPEFSERIWSAVQSRFKNDQDSRFYIERWQSICAGVMRGD
jgi:hypothetical protein